MLREHAGALSYLYQQLFSTIGAVVRLVITLGPLMSVDPLIGLLGAVAVPGVLISHWRSGVDKAVEEAGAQHNRRARHLFSLGVSAAAGKEIRVGGVQQCLRTTQRTAWEQRHVPLSRTKWTTTGWEVLAQAVFAAGFVGAVTYTATKDGAGPGDILLVLTAGSRLAEYVNSTVTQTQFYRSIGLDVSRRLAWLEDFVAADLADADLSAPERLDQGIRLENVSFHYPGSEKPALEDISLDLPAGKVIALVGENGASTSLVKLLCRFYASAAGTIRVDGRDLARISPVDWRVRISGAFQDFFRFEYLVRQSVGLGDLPRMDAVAATRTALARAGAEDMVFRLPHGVDTQLGAAWDEQQRSSGRITLLVSPRFSSIRMADLIVVLVGSRQVEYGTHEELMARGGQYHELYTLQTSSYQAGARP